MCARDVRQRIIMLPFLHVGDHISRQYFLLRLVRPALITKALQEIGGLLHFPTLP
jgi:hypothetical protein